MTPVSTQNDLEQGITQLNMPLELKENEVHVISKSAFLGILISVTGVILIPVFGLFVDWIVGLLLGIPTLLFGVYKIMNPPKSYIFTPTGIRVIGKEGQEEELIDPSRITGFSISAVVNKQTNQSTGFNVTIKLDKGKIRLWGGGYYSGLEENTAGKDAVANYLVNVYGKELN